MKRPALEPYVEASHRDGCLAVFDSNLPKFFAPDERALLEAFLAAPRGRYFVVCDEGRVIASGGVAMRGDDAVLTWGMVHATLHRRGIGRDLTEARIEIAREMGASRLCIDTTPHSEGFYVRVGFVATAREPDGFGPGLDRVSMLLALGGAA